VFVLCSFCILGVPRGNARIRVSQNRVEWHGDSAGDAISAEGATHLWVDHCHFESTVDKAEDKLIVIKRGSKGVTISNNMFRNQDKVQFLSSVQDSGRVYGAQ